jgi:hemoglobin-like flavoprotein
VRWQLRCQWDDYLLTHYRGTIVSLDLTTTQVELIKSSFSKVVPIADQAAGLFYGRLFEVAPEIRPLFKSVDMSKQGVKLMQMIGQAVSLLNAPEKLVPALQNLGQRHVDYGVTAAHYDIVGAALLWTLEQGLGADFTDETREAWTKVYTIMADTARNAAYAPTNAADLQ